MSPADRVLVGDVLVGEPGLETARLHRRAALLARTGGGVVVAPVVGSERLMYPGVRHVPLRVPAGLSREKLGAEVAERVGEVLDDLKPRLLHTMGLSSAIPALLRRRGGVVVIEPGLMPSQWLRDHQPELPAERLVDMVELEDRTLGRADAVLARSVVEAATLVRRGVAHERVHTAPDGVPIGLPETDLPDLPHVLWIGDLEPWSGWQMPLEALARVKAPWRLTMVTPADAPTGQIEHHARALRVADRLALSRDLSLEALGLRLEAAQVVVCSLLHRRSTEAGAVVPEAVLWALAAGRPILAPDLPVVRAYAGAAARYFAPGDVGALAERLTGLLGDAAARAELATRAGFAAVALSWDETERPVADLWSTLLAD